MSNICFPVRSVPLKIIQFVPVVIHFSNCNFLFKKNENSARVVQKNSFSLRYNDTGFCETSSKTQQSVWFKLIHYGSTRYLRLHFV
jgi:hypothetical protein